MLHSIKRSTGNQVLWFAISVMHQWVADLYGKESTFATMDQYKTLWDGEYKGGLPLIFNFMNNLYGMGGQTMGETMGYDILARVGAGVNPE